MKLKCSGIEGGWMQVVDINMNRDENCPGTWHKVTTPRRLHLGSLAAGCASSHFYVKGVSYEHICGQAKGYQKDQQMLMTQPHNPLMVSMLMVFPSL